jgi:hypothetical protein
MAITIFAVLVGAMSIGHNLLMITTWLAGPLLIRCMPSSQNVSVLETGCSSNGKRA